MSLEELVGATYGPYVVGISAEKVTEYVRATGDVPDRWENHAPPGYASALLFVVAPHFLDDPRVRPFTGVLVHVDQTFTWHHPIEVGVKVTVTGRVDRVRERSGSYFVAFSASVTDAEGERLLESVATFLMGEGAPPDGQQDHREPIVWVRGHNEHPGLAPLPDVGESLAGLDKSASRIDLVKYAAATGDYNPIHFDHNAALHAGLDGIVVHGLLMAAWAMQVAAGVSARPDPLAHIKIRFRNVLHPGESARVGGIIRDVAVDTGDCRISLDVASADVTLVTADCVVRLDR